MKALMQRVERINKKLTEADRLLPPYERCFLDDELDQLLQTDMKREINDVTKYLALVMYQAKVEKEFVKFNMERFLEYVAKDSVPGKYNLHTDDFVRMVYEYALIEDPELEEKFQLLCDELGLPEPNFDQNDIHSNLLTFKSIAGRFIHDRHVFKLTSDEFIKKLGMDQVPWNGTDAIEW